MSWVLSVKIPESKMDDAWYMSRVKINGALPISSDRFDLQWSGGPQTSSLSPLLCLPDFRDCPSDYPSAPVSKQGLIHYAALQNEDAWDGAEKSGTLLWMVRDCWSWLAWQALLEFEKTCTHITYNISVIYNTNIYKQIDIFYMFEITTATGPYNVWYWQDWQDIHQAIQVSFSTFLSLYDLFVRMSTWFSDAVRRLPCHWRRFWSRRYRRAWTDTWDPIRETPSFPSPDSCRQRHSELPIHVAHTSYLDVTKLARCGPINSEYPGL